LLFLAIKDVEGDGCIYAAMDRVNGGVVVDADGVCGVNCNHQEW